MVGDFGKAALGDRLMKRFDIILGVCEGKEITLLGCSEETRNFYLTSEAQSSQSSYRVEQILVGQHFKERKGIKFGRMVVEYSHLNEWAGVSGIKVEAPANVDDEWIIRYKRPPRIEWTKVGDYNFSIDFGVSFPSFAAVQSEAKFEQSSGVVIRNTTKQHLDEYWKFARSIQDLLSLGVDVPVHIVSLKGRIDDDSPSQNLVRVYFGQAGFPKSIGYVHPGLMTFRLADMPVPSSGSNDYLKNWLEKNERLQPILALYSTTVYGVPTYLENEFLNMVQALESYHRRFASNYELRTEEHQKRIEEIVGAVKEDYRDWLRNQLQFSNELSLRKRLRDIVDRYASAIERTIGNKEEFVETVISARNYQTHYDEKLKSRAASGQNLFRITQVLKLLLEMCLVEELGFDRGQVNVMFGRKASRIATIPLS